jgi:hypothetical protein
LGPTFKQLIIGFFLLLVIGAACKSWAGESILPARDNVSVYRATTGDLTVRLFELPCESELILRDAPPHIRPQLRHAEVIEDGEEVGACWLPHPQDGTPYVADELGNFGAIIEPAFKRGLEI